MHGPPLAADVAAVIVSETPPTSTLIVRIVIADDHPIFRDGLRRLLETAADLRIVGDTDAAGASALVRKLRPDILLLAGSAFPGVALEAISRPTASGAPVRVILLARSLDGPEVVAALRFGAHAVLPKDSAPDVLFKSIKSVMDGHCWVGTEHVPNLAAGVRRLRNVHRRAKAFGLTARELEVVRAVMCGDTNRMIAQNLSISENTVKRHLTHIFNKVGASTRVELALFAAHHQLVADGFGPERTR